MHAMQTNFCSVATVDGLCGLRGIDPFIMQLELILFLLGASVAMNSPKKPKGVVLMLGGEVNTACFHHPAVQMCALTHTLL